MHIVNSCANDIEHTENNKQGQSANYISLEQVLVSFCMVFPKFSDNFCRKHCLLTSLLMCCFSHLHGKQFPSILNKTTYFHMHIYISEFVIPLCCRHQAVLSCTCKEYSKVLQFLAAVCISVLIDEHFHGALYSWISLIKHICGIIFVFL